jgi:hypothetical protein
MIRAGDRGTRGDCAIEFCAVESVACLGSGKDGQGCVEKEEDGRGRRHGGSLQDVRCERVRGERAIYNRGYNRVRCMRGWLFDEPTFRLAEQGSVVGRVREVTRASAGLDAKAL